MEKRNNSAFPLVQQRLRHYATRKEDTNRHKTSASGTDNIATQSPYAAIQEGCRQKCGIRDFVLQIVSDRPRMGRLPHFAYSCNPTPAIAKTRL